MSWSVASCVPTARRLERRSLCSVNRCCLLHCLITPCLAGSYLRAVPWPGGSLFFLGLAEAGGSEHAHVNSGNCGKTACVALSNQREAGNKCRYCSIFPTSSGWE